MALTLIGALAWARRRPARLLDRASIEIQVYVPGQGWRAP